ncbi:MAG: ComEC/Rec2 family competence protein [Lachnospiraceae bacterium]
MYKKYFQIIILFICLCLWGCGTSTEEPATEAFTTETGTSQQEYVTESPVGDIELDESRLVRRGEEENTDENESNHIESGDTLEVHYMDIGQGDAILIRQGDSAMLIDAGNNDKGTTVWSYLLSQKVEDLDYAIGTHPDADHVGGLDVVLYKLDCETIFLPACENDTETYRELIQTIGQKNQKVTVPEQGAVYSLGKAKFQILTDTDKDYGENTNNFSIAIRLTYGDTSFLFTGDAEEEAERDMLASGLVLASDVYKAAHHGADTANTEDFLTAVNPVYCVISCGEDNAYGHPRAGFLNTIRTMGVKVFRTDEQGTIVAVSDGENITFNTSPSDSWKAGEPRGSYVSIANENETGTTTKDDYILNTNTKKFHRPDCSSVKKMADKNKQTSHKSREELIADGYEPCKNCNP